MESKLLDYALVTPARNEEKFIEETIRSMIKQTHVPLQWVIVNDGSTDRTSEIVKSYVSKFSWIQLIDLPVRSERRFDAKVNSFNVGYLNLNTKKVNIIGNVDADISFEKDLMKYLVIKFMEIPRLGVAGIPFIENNNLVYKGKFVDLNHVSGGCQLFRMQCYNEIGGFTPVKHGGVDWIAVTTARMIGWKTQTFTEKKYIHLRPMGTGNAGKIMSRFNHGIKDYYLGNLFIWQVLRSINQMFSKPYIISGIMLFTGYIYAAITGIKKPISKELIKFHQKEQIERILHIIKIRGEKIHAN
jgi:glycosyltransferase involved in cell wall biosynthesis